MCVALRVRLGVRKAASWPPHPDAGGAGVIGREIGARHVDTANTSRCPQQELCPRASSADLCRLYATERGLARSRAVG